MRPTHLLTIAALSLTACATATESRFSGYLDKIHKEHDGQLVNPDKTPVSDRTGTREYRDAFNAKVCGGLDAIECDKEFNNAVFMQLQDRYYAADHKRIGSVCAHDPVDCDTREWERRVAVSHNEGIEWHRGQALLALESWRLKNPK